MRQCIFYLSIKYLICKAFVIHLIKYEIKTLFLSEDIIRSPESLRLPIAMGCPPLSWVVINIVSSKTTAPILPNLVFSICMVQYGQRGSCIRPRPPSRCVNPFRAIPPQDFIAEQSQHPPRCEVPLFSCLGRLPVKICR